MKEIKYLPDIKYIATYTCPICDSVYDAFEKAVACRGLHLDLTNFKPTRLS